MNIKQVIQELKNESQDLGSKVNKAGTCIYESEDNKYIKDTMSKIENWESQAYKIQNAINALEEIK